MQQADLLVSDKFSQVGISGIDGIHHILEDITRTDVSFFFKCEDQASATRVIVISNSNVIIIKQGYENFIAQMRIITHGGHIKNNLAVNLVCIASSHIHLVRLNRLCRGDKFL